MRCPKCGYNSFDHLNSCKKCGKDLVEFKQKFGVRSVLFPGQMRPGSAAVEAEFESGVVDVAVAAATASVAATAVSSVDEVTIEPSAAQTSKADDFGFDFMGDSEEDDDLSFDELFEDAPADEDVEDALEAPEEDSSPVDEADEFSFDLPEEEDDAAAVADLDDDFGFNPDDTAEDTVEASEFAEDLDSDEFELPPAKDEDFSFRTDEDEFEDSTAEDAGTEEDPKDPFELPESSLEERAPEQNLDLFSDDPALTIAVEKDALYSESDSWASSPVDEEARPSAVAEDPDFTSPDAWDADSGQSAPFLAAEAIDTQEAEVLPLADELTTADVDTAKDENTVSENSGGDLATEEKISLLPPTVNRVGAFFCDLLLLLVVGAGFIIAAEAAISATDDSLLPSLETLIDLSVPYFLVLFSLAFGYFTLFHFLVGQTPGKMLTGLRVETTEGTPLVFSQAFLRSVGGLLQLLPAGLGYLAILTSADRRGWNDQLAGTRLVALKGIPEDA